MSTGWPSSNTVSTHNQKSQHVMKYTSTQQEKSINTGRRITDHESTRKNRTYYKSTPKARCEQMSRHINSYTSTYKQNNVQRSTQDKNNTWKDRHSFTYVSTQKSRNALARRHVYKNRPTLVRTVSTFHKTCVELSCYFQT